MIKFNLSDEQKLIFGAIGVVILLVIFYLALGGIFNACDSRKLKKLETNINTAQSNVENSEQKVTQAKEESAETKGEIKVLKENLDEQNLEVNRKIKERREAVANGDRIRRQPVSNVSGAELNRILNEADNR